MHLTSQNVLATPDQLAQSPSRRDGIDEEKETLQRFYGAHLVQEMCIILKLPQVAAATGQYLLQRFYCSHSLAAYDVRSVAVASLFLAAKIEEVPRRSKDFVNALHYAVHRIEASDGREYVPLEPMEAASMELRDELFETERAILSAVRFLVCPTHPHKFLVNYIRLLSARNIAQQAWNYVNDCSRTVACMLYTPEVIACAGVWMASRRQAVALPSSWLELFSVSERDVVQVAALLCRVYSMGKPRWLPLCRRFSAAASIPPTAAATPTSDLRSPTDPCAADDGDLRDPPQQPQSSPPIVMLKADAPVHADTGDAKAITGGAVSDDAPASSAALHSETVLMDVSESKVPAQGSAEVAPAACAPPVAPSDTTRESPSVAPKTDQRSSGRDQSEPTRYSADRDQRRDEKRNENRYRRRSRSRSRERGDRYRRRDSPRRRRRSWSPDRRGGRDPRSRNSRRSRSRSRSRDSKRRRDYYR